MSQASESRLRPHPAERFEANEHYFDLKQAVAGLLQEPHAAQQGHRQITLNHYGDVTIVLIAFEAGSSLPDHVAEGLETIQILDGAVTVRVDNQTMDIGAGHLLVLNPGVHRSMQAKEDSQILLTVHLGGDKHQDSPRRPELAQVGD
jgi:quercetin dioxygenase-like cupin family protein